MLGIDSESLSTGANDTKYTKAINVPQYLPKNSKPDIRSLCNTEKFLELRDNIVKCDKITDEEKVFLLNAATRHIVFNYSLIADYYAHSNKELQELMEQSALVIIDMNDAIANGYVKLSKNIRKIMDDTGRKTVGDEEDEG